MMARGLMFNSSSLYFLMLISFIILPSYATLLYRFRVVTNQRIEAAKGSEVRITCTGGSNPTWKKGNNRIVLAPSESADVVQINKSSSSSSTLKIKSLTPTNMGMYKCHLNIGNVPTVQTVTVGIESSTSTTQPLPTAPPTSPRPTKVQGVTFMKTIQGSSPALRVSWRAVSGSGITYTVCYSTTIGTQSDPPSNVNCDTSGITGTSTTLSPLNRGTIYYIWVAAVSSGGQGPYSDRRQSITYNAPVPVSSFQARPSTTIFGLIITWGPPSGSNYPTPVTHQLRYRERPSSGSPGGWSSTVQRTATQRQYTTPVLKPGTRYEVEVWTVTSIGRGQSVTRTATTYQLPGQVTFLRVKPSSTILGLIITWGPPSGSNYPTPVTYRLRYRERPSSGPPGGWSSTVQRTATQRQFTTPVLKPGTRYEVKVWAVASIGIGHSHLGTATTGVFIQVESVNSSSITVVTSGNLGTVSYKEVGSSDEPMSSNVPPSKRVHISGLKPNTEYNISYSETNSHGSRSAVSINFTLSEAPSHLKLAVISSKSIEITWNAPQNSQSLSYYVGYTSAMTTAKTESPTVSTNITLTGLHPYEEYTISVQAGNRAGLSVPVTGTARTYSDKPSSAPTMQDCIKKASQWCLVHWNLPEKSGRNGIITHYIIELSNTNGKVWNITHKLKQFNFTFPGHLTHNLTYLIPYTKYKWRVAAATVNGTGLFTTNTVDFRTRQDVPGQVSGLSYKVISNESVNISWSAPMEPNGVIKGYNVSYREIEGNVSKKYELGPDSYHKILESLKIHTPYEVTVTANTTVGAGVSVYQVVFSEQGVPIKPVENVVASRVDSIRVKISWIPLSLVEARGFPLYTISYMSDRGVPKSVNTSNSSVIIHGLCQHRTYVFTIQVSNGNWTGETTTQVTLPGEELATEGGGPASAVAAAVAVLLIIIIAAIIAICIVVCFRRRRKAATGASAMIPVHFEKKGKNEYTLGIGSGGMGDVANILGESLVMADGGHKIITRKSFLAVTKQLHLNRDRGFEEEFKTIVNDPNGSDVIAKTNRRKNRYGNITTYDHCRVVLSVPDENGSDYINASYVNGYAIANAYIASQGPTPATVSDFWQMLWDQKCPVIVMLTKVEEGGRKKCHQYWEDELLKPYEPGRGLEVIVTSVKGYANYDVREITLSNPSSRRSKPHKLKQFHYTGWPDHGVPTHPSSLVKFVQQVRKEYKNSTAPLLVHCSAGVGRTGTFITIDAMLERLQEKDDLNIYQFVTAMRTRRTFMVQTMEQYAFIHDALCDYLTCGDTSVEAHELRMEIQNLCQADVKTRKSGFQQQFELLDSVSKKPVSEDESFSKKATVVKKNRYKDKFPYSNCYVRAPGKGPTGGADYMNASYIDSYSRNKAFIAAQAPLESTKNDVWEMIWQFRPSTVVVLCDLQEKKQEACSRFWPDEREKSLNVGFLKVNNKSTERDTIYDLTRLEVFDSRKESSKVLHVSLFHLKDWDKEGRPTTEAVLRLMGDVQNSTASPSGAVIPAVVMCDDGMGRSGVFICAMSEVERVKVEGQVDVFQTIKGMRIQRPHMVETADQYKLCFEILQSYLDSFDTYANFKPV